MPPRALSSTIAAKTRDCFALDFVLAFVKCRDTEDEICRHLFPRAPTCSSSGRSIPSSKQLSQRRDEVRHDLYDLPGRSRLRSHRLDIKFVGRQEINLEQLENVLRALGIEADG